MTIVFDLMATQPLGNSVHGGGEYGKSVFFALLAEASGRDIVAFYDKTRRIDQSLTEAAEQYGVELTPVSDMSDVQAVIDSCKDGIFYSALPYAYHGVDFHDLKVVMTIHGLRPIEVPCDVCEFRYARSARDLAKWAAKLLLKNAYVKWRTSQFATLTGIQGKHLQIVVPSEHSKFALLNAVPSLDPTSVTVLFSPATAVQSKVVADSQILQEYGLTERDYILIVSGNRWVKNSYRALLALSQMEEVFSVGKQVVVVGGSPVWVPRNWKSKFHFLPYVTDEQLVGLYANAFSLLYPTLNEGFGYPPLEAMRHGTPILCSAITSTTEILGDAPLYFSPYSIQEMQVRIARLLQDEGLWSRMSQQSLARYAEISSKQQQMLTQLCEILLT